MTLRNALEGLAEEVTLEGVLEAIAQIVARDNADGSAMLISGNAVRWRREFNDPTLADWDVVTGPGQSVSVAGGILSMVMGTTANAETTVTSKQSFSTPFDVQFGIQLSQKIANNEVYVEIVSELPDGSAVDDTVVAAWRLSGTDSVTTTNARTEVRNGGAARSQSGNIASQAAQTGAMAIYQIVLESDEVRFYSKVGDATTAKSAGAVRNTIAPNPTRRYRVRYRIRNGAVAPASSTTVTSSHVVAVDYTEVKTEVTGSGGAINSDQALPVYMTGGSASVSMTSTAIAALATVVGTIPYKIRSAATTNLTSIKATAGRLYGWRLKNTGAAAAYVKFYNKASAPVLATDVPVFVIDLAPGETVDQSAITVPVSFATGIAMSITGGMADTDATAVAADQVRGTLLYI